MIAIYYLYYRIFKLIKLISLKSSYFRGRVVFFFSMATGCNLVTLLKVIGINVLTNKFIIIICAFIWFIFWLKFFNNPDRLKKILELFDNETFLHKVFGGLGVIVYLIGSFIFFIKTMVV